MSMAIRADFWGQLSAPSTGSNFGDLFSALERMASGQKINGAADDPAGLVVSKQLQGRIAALNQEIKNVSGTIDKYETASGSVKELRESLNELRSLAVGAVNSGGNSEEAQEAYATAASTLEKGYNRTIENANYNGAATLDGSESALAKVSTLEGIDLSSPQAAAASLETIDQAASELDKVMSELGATQKYGLESERRSLEVTRQNLEAAESTLSDTNYALEMSKFASSLIRSQATMALMGHSFMTNASVVSLLSPRG
jgi:flagellin